MNRLLPTIVLTALLTPAHAATFDCDGVKVVFTPSSLSQASDGSYQVETPDELTVNAIPVVGLRTGGSLTFQDTSDRK